MKTKIFFANHAQFEGKNTNLGDWAIFEQMIGKLKPYIDNDDVEVIVPTSDPEFTKNNYPVTAIKRGGVSGVLNTIKWILKSNIVVIGGGEIVQDRSSMVYIPYQLIRPLIGKLFKKKLLGYAIGIGEQEEISIFGKWLAKFVLNKFDIITVRDEKSLRILREHIGVTLPKIYLTADPALNLVHKTIPEPLPKNKYFVVSVRSVYHRNHNILPFSIRKKLNLVSKDYYNEINIFKNDIASIVEDSIERYGYRAHFLNTYTGKEMSAEDDIFTNSIISKISLNNRGKISIINPEYTPAQIKKHLKNAEFILSVPLHPLILGASEGVPVMSLAYASKNRCFMEQIHLERFIYNVEKIGDRIDKDLIKNDIHEIVLNRDRWSEKIINRAEYLKSNENLNMDLLLQLCDVIENRV